MTADKAPDDGVLAAELALGLLEGGERAGVLRRMLSDARFARDVARWRDHFATLFAEVPEVAPDAAVAMRLRRAIDRERGGAVTRWRWATAAVSALAAGLALVLVVRPGEAPTPVTTRPVPVRASPALAAAMTPTAKGAAFAAVYDTRGGEVRIAAGIDVPAGRVAELWRIGADGVPHSLGLLDSGQPTAITLSAADRAALATGATLAISIEPPGGSPKPVPTGPVVATGTLSRV